MKTLKTIFVIILIIIGMTSCEENISLFNDPQSSDNLSSEMLEKVTSMLKATGSVEFLWKGADKGGEMGNKPDSLRAFFTFNAHEGYSDKPSKGEIIYQVTKPDLTLHREITATVIGVKVIDAKAWFVAIVTSDTKGCQGNGGGGHDANCSESDHTDEGGGCGEETDGHDGGCSDGGTDEGGCSDGGTDEGGCSDGGTDEGGCSDGGTDEGGCSDSGSGEEGGPSGMGSGEEGGPPDMGSGSPGGSRGNPLSGKNCRLGQLIAVKVHDVGSPGINDGLTWKWFSPVATFVPSIENINLWPHLCKKIIIEGNLVVHN